MSSSGSRGPPMSRYKSNYDYNKPKRKPYYAGQPPRSASGSSLVGSSMPGSSSLTHSTGLDNGSAPVGSSRSRYASTSINNGSAPPTRDRNTYGSYSSSSKNSYGSYYSSYGSYNSFKRDTGDNWRSDRYKSNGPSSASADLRPPTGRHPSLAASATQSSLSLNSSSAYSSRPISDRYDSYSTDAVRKSSYSRLLNRNSLSNSVGPRSVKERRGSLVSTGKRSDTYYPNKASNLIYNKAQIDHYSSRSFDDNRRKSRDYDREDNYEENYSDNIDSRDDNYNASGKYGYDEEDEDDDEDGEESASDRNDDSGEESESDYNPSMLGLPIDGGEKADGSMKDPLSDINHNNEDAHVQAEDSKLEQAEKNAQNNEVDQTTQDPTVYGVFPANRLEGMYNALVEEFHSNKDTLRYLSKTPITNFQDYPFWNRNLRLHTIKKPNLSDYLSSQAELISKKKVVLWKSYKEGLDNWDKSRKFMDQQLQILHPPNDEMKKELEQIDVRIKKESASESSPSTPANNSRRSRRHGDSVTTEAEFEEILKSLTKQDDEDPMAKATRLSAPIPDLILDQTERQHLNFMDSNNFVNDKAEWASRVRTEFFDNFSPEEHALFCEAFVKYPKKFGFIARHLGGLRTTRECVIHYYLTKKGVNYKNLVLQHKRKNRKVTNGRGRGKPKSRNVSQNNTTVETPTEELEGPELMPIEKEETPVPIPIPPAYSANDSFGEELFTETGRRKRAAAPTFEGVEKKADPNAPPKKKTKRKKDDIKKLEEREDNAAENTETPVKAETELHDQDNSNAPANADAAVADSNAPAENGTQQGDEGKDGRKPITSYWSISEATLFPELLKSYGTKWTTIADKLNTKTATMVRNYFQRNASKFEWLNIAEEADKRLEEKFASVFSKSEDDGEGSNSENIPNGTDKHEHASPISSLLEDNTKQIVPTSPVANGKTHYEHKEPVVKTEVKIEPHSTKPSIMSLLNAEPSPIKAVATSESVIDPDLEASSLSARSNPSISNNINGLLNAPSAKALPPVSDQQVPSTRVMPRLSTILSGDSLNDDDK